MPGRGPRRRCSCHDAGAARSPRSIADVRQLPLPGPAVPLPGGAGRGAEAEGDQLHPRRGLPGRRDEARPDRPGGRGHAVGLPDAARAGLRQGDEQPGRDQGPRRPGDRHRLRGRRGGGRRGRRRDLRARTCRSTCSRWWRWCRCSCWPTTSPCCAAATWTSRATWPRASRSSDVVAPRPPARSQGRRSQPARRCARRTSRGTYSVRKSPQQTHTLPRRAYRPLLW